jgi:mycofactocin system FadH/OYE family oxidoreductase 2
MADQLKNLFSPLQIGGHQVRNRIVFAAHATNFARDNLPGERHLHYYAARAKGGAGLIIMEEAVVHPSDFPSERTIFGFDERIVPRYQRIADLVHHYGTAILAQLNHNGQQSSGAISRAPVWAPSAVPDVTSLEVPKVMEREDIAEVVAGFARSAALAKRGGLDGVEVNAGQRSLIRQFLSPLTNQRNDEYGGSLENRLRFCQEVLQAVRREAGSRWVVGLRLCGDELAPWAGLTPEHSREIARHLGDTGMIDYLSVDVGSIYSVHITWAPMCFPQDHMLPVVEAMRQAVSLPVCSAEGIIDPVYADGIVREGKADLVDMTRALIADPELPLKAQEGRWEDIRPCLRCNQGCLVRSPMNPPLSCIHNPAVGREGEGEDLRLTPRRKKVMIVGGGPAGMEVARVAALRGHEVTLYEKEQALGGQVRLAAQGPGRGELLKVIRYLETHLSKSGVKVRLGTEVTPSLVEAESPDVVVVATGSLPAGRAIPGDAPGKVVEARQVLRGEAKVGQKVLVIDEQGAHKAASVAELLADQGKEVELITADIFVSRELAASQDLIPWYQRAFSKGIKLTPRTIVRKVDVSRVEVADSLSGESQYREEVDTVVLAMYDEPAQELYFALKDRVPELYRIGDCVAPRRISQAIFEGNRLGREL